MAIVILSGSNTDLSNTSNYSTGSLPSNGDTLIVEQRTASFTSGLSALSSIQLANLIVRSSFTGNFGAVNSNHAEIDSDYVTFEGGGSVNLFDFGSTACNRITVVNTGSGAQNPGL